MSDLPKYLRGQADPLTCELGPSATVAEVYSLTLALLTAAVWLLLRWRRVGAAGPLPWLVGLLLGLGIGVHHVTVILAAPGLLAFVVAAGGRRAVAPRRLLGAAAGGAAGVLSYLYLPLAAARRPVLNWGDPSSLERFWWHVSARQYRVNLFSGSFDQVRENLAELVARPLRARPGGDGGGSGGIALAVATGPCGAVACRPGGAGRRDLRRQL